MNLFERVKNLIVSPAQEWELIKTEPSTVPELFARYAAILALIPVVAGFIGLTAIGYLGVGTGLVWALLYYLLSLAGVFALGIIIDAMATSFGSQKDQVASMKVAVYAYTAIWVGGIFQIIPVLSILGILGLYSLYLLWVGMKKVKEVPDDKMIGYYILVALIAFGINVIIGVITSIVTAGAAISSAFRQAAAG